MNIKINTIKFKENCISILLSIYMFLSFYSLFADENIRLYVMVLISLYGLIVAIFSITNKFIIQINGSYLQIIFTIVLIYIAIQLIHLRTPFSVIFTISSCFMSYMIIQIKLNVKLFYANFIIITLSFLSFFIKGIDPNEVFNGTSRNIISVVMLMNVALISLIEYKNGKQLSIWPSFIGMLFSIWAIGRSGIACSIILFLVVIYYRYWDASSWKRFLSFLKYIFVIGIIFLLIIIEFNIDFLNLFLRFEIQGFVYGDDGRAEIMEAYLSNIDLFSFLFGYDYLNDPFIMKWGNLHNSFLSLHSIMGIGVFIFIVYVAYSFTFLFKTARPLFYIFLILLVRIFFDAVCFNGLYDFIILSFLLISYEKQKAYNLKINEIENME